MYVWIWRRLPGPFGVKLGLACVLIALAATVLWTVVFPLASDWLGAPAVRS